MGAGDVTEAGDDRPAPDSRRPAAIGLLLLLGLVVVGYCLFSALRENAKLEDCLMSGRKNCAPIETPAPRR